MAARWRDWARMAWPVAAPLLMCGLLLLLLQEPLRWWLHGEEIYDEQAMVEWLREARIGFKTLPELLRELVASARQQTEHLRTDASQNPIVTHEQKRAE